MADSQAVATPAQAGAGANEGAAAPPQSTWSVITGVLFRMWLMWMFMSWLRGDNKVQDKSGDGQNVAVKSSYNLFPLGEDLAMWAFVNEEEIFTKFTDPNAMFWNQDPISYGDWNDGPNKDGSFMYNSTLDISEKVQNNGSLYIHIYFTQSGHFPDPSLGKPFSKENTVLRSKQLNRYKKRTIKKTQNLLTGETKTDPDLLKHMEEHGSIEILSHWHPNLTINLVVDQTPWTKGKIPAPIDELVYFRSESSYEPIIYLNDYWNLMREHTPINSSVKQLNLCLTFQPITMWKLQMYVSQSMRNQWYNVLGDDYAQESEEDQDSVKEAILETNPYMLGLTVIVSIVHSVFEFLAFKNDIQFWRTRKSLEGLSVRSILWGVVQSVIVLLYVMDNDTNFVIRVSIFVGCLIDGWKITKVVSIGLDRENRWFGVIPRLTFTDNSSYVQSETKKYDQLAFKYLGMLFFPLLVAYAIYSLIYDEHKGVYSYVLGMLYGFLLTFGFIMMTPQLFINYKLKSVAHLPWRMLTYKALNTFIDDIFAFVIKMPTMYRIGCFRDDIVFFIYLYQRYAYRVDPKRVNEFGTSAEILESPAQDANNVTTPSVTDKKND
ncbi:unnamed protein product [Clavelina lepadiformis]|uniref:Cleft lip and palate associated transmembrane protein n=1 Tax=Clavelina lepadiformis TaxID=159417 RepID=A0ABP0GCD7_CLALP